MFISNTTRPDKLYPWGYAPLHWQKEEGPLPARLPLRSDGREALAAAPCPCFPSLLHGRGLNPYIGPLRSLAGSPCGDCTDRMSGAGRLKEAVAEGDYVSLPLRSDLLHSS